MEIKNLNLDVVRNFWIWFSIHHKEFGHDFENEGLLEELDERINSIGEFAWELGPGFKAQNQLVISPGGDIELLPVTKEIVENAIPIPDWEFYYAKPKKSWDLTFDFTTADDGYTRIDASKWKYVLLKYEDGMFEIIIEASELLDMTEDDKSLAAEILLDGLLGEEKRLTTICYIDVTAEFDHQYKSKANNIEVLDKHLDSLM